MLGLVYRVFGIPESSLQLVPKNHADLDSSSFWVGPGGVGMGGKKILKMPFFFTNP